MTRSVPIEPHRGCIRKGETNLLHIAGKSSQQINAEFPAYFPNRRSVDNSANFSLTYQASPDPKNALASLIVVSHSFSTYSGG